MAIIFQWGVRSTAVEQFPCPPRASQSNFTHRHTRGVGGSTAPWVHLFNHRYLQNLARLPSPPPKLSGDVWRVPERRCPSKNDVISRTSSAPRTPFTGAGCGGGAQSLHLMLLFALLSNSWQRRGHFVFSFAHSKPKAWLQAHIFVLIGDWSKGWKTPFEPLLRYPPKSGFP